MRDILERPSGRRRDEFLAAVARSRKLHGHWATPPRTTEAFEAYLKRLKQSAYVGHWVRTETNEPAGVININEIVRGTFCSGYLGYYAFVPHNGRGYMTVGLRAVISQAFRRLRLHRLEANSSRIMTLPFIWYNGSGFGKKGSHPVTRTLARSERWALIVGVAVEQHH